MALTVKLLTILWASWFNTTPPQPVTLKAADGTSVFGDFYSAGHKSRPLVLLFHQAGSNRGEYRSIAPRLQALGFHGLAIDQRSRGRMWDRPNETVTKRGGSTRRNYLAALPDLEAALAWKEANGYTGHTIVWGSSYSAALAFLLAARHPGKVAAIVAMSPGEYLGKKRLVARHAKRVTIPTLIMAAPKEKRRAQHIYKSLAANRKRLYTPKRAVHGSSMLISSRTKDADRHFKYVAAFLEPLRPAEDCKTIQTRFKKTLDAADNRCEQASDCGCYNPVAPSTGCGGVTDHPTHVLLQAIETTFHKVKCRWPIHCAAWICGPSCTQGRCQR